MIFHLEDLESDFSRFHRVDDIYAMTGPRFMRMAWRIEAYGGVMSLRRQEHAHERRPAQAPAAADAGDREVSLAEFMLQVPGAIELVKVEA